MSVKSVTTQGVVEGRVTLGSAVTVLDDPFTYGPDADANGISTATTRRNKKRFRATKALRDITPPREIGKIGASSWPRGKRERTRAPGAKYGALRGRLSTEDESLYSAGWARNLNLLTPPSVGRKGTFVAVRSAADHAILPGPWLPPSRASQQF